MNEVFAANVLSFRTAWRQRDSATATAFRSRTGDDDRHRKATFTQGARSDAMEPALDELPHGSFGLLQHGGAAGVAIELVAVRVEGSRIATLI